MPTKNGFSADAAISPAISAPRPAKPIECASMPSSVFMVMTKKSKVDFPPERISESDMAGWVLRQTRISMDLILTWAPGGGKNLLNTARPVNKMIVL